MKCAYFGGVPENGLLTFNGLILFLISFRLIENFSLSGNVIIAFRITL